ncbi:3-deoxy-7-phosphoheptulonate synthase, partial [Parvimonas micra]
DGKRAAAPIVNQIAANGIAHHADWFVTPRNMENAMGSWSPASWQQAEARQMPDYPDTQALDAMLTELGRFPPLVFAGEARQLTAEL